MISKVAAGHWQPGDPNVRRLGHADQNFDDAYTGRVEVLVVADVA